MTPTFAVVGHPNKGKSSVVATLVENAEIAISPMPGTTYHADSYTLNVAGEALYSLTDTPGFQRPGAVLAWLTERENNATERAALVAEFVALHNTDERFHDECALLQPIIDGAGILYVVDGTKPYAPEFEIEMQILQWTGQPRMALINLIGTGDYVEEWRQALGQYFSIVRVFDAMQADFAARTGLLRAFGELDTTWMDKLQQAVRVLETERDKRLHAVAKEIVDLLSACLTFAEQRTLEAGYEVNETNIATELREKLLHRIRRREVQARQRVQGLFHQNNIDREEIPYTLVDEDLFTDAVWQLFGLSRSQLVATGGVSGALAGGSLDLIAGGTSFMLGSIIGATIGSVTAWLGGDELARFRVLGTPLGGTVAQVGPVAKPNFAWVLLGRALVHARLVSERNHALRTAFVNEFSLEETEGNLFDSLTSDQRRRLAQSFSRIQKATLTDSQRHELTTMLAELIKL